MTAMRHIRLGGLDIAHRDPYEHDVQYIYGEIFVDEVYDHPRLKIPNGATIMDVGGNVGFYSLWAARKYRPKTLLTYEASPTTYECLADNLARLVEPEVTTATCFNRAVSRVADQELVLHQPPWNSGLSTLVDGGKLAWVDELRAKGELITHKVRSTTISREIEIHRLPAIDLLKIDVEGHFMEVLEGIVPADTAKVRNIVLEAEYAEKLGHSRESLCDYLRGKGYTVEAKDAAQIMIYAWRD